MKKIKKYFKKKLEKKNKTIFIIVLFLVVFLSFIFFIILFIYYSKVIKPLPDVKNLKDIKMPEASIIYDKNGGELYKIYSENRVYVHYDYISKHMINAIVAGEDKRFWTNPGFDIFGISRAIIDGLKHSNHFSGTSGITQQLAKIVYLSSEKSLERKLKELYLAIKLNNNFSKKDILELYLNKVFFGGNSYGVEQASKTYFGINASELNILQSSILASLPKAPTSLSPYNHKKDLLGYPIVFLKKTNEKKEIISKNDVEENKQAIDILTGFISGLKIYHLGDKLKICGINNNRINTKNFKLVDKCVTIPFYKFLDFLNSIYIEKGDYIIEYKTGRKDYILSRMFEDKYITAKDFKKAIIDSFGFTFNKYIDKIRYPYFVMYVKDYLVKKYGEDILKEGGYRIYTSIDPKVQDEAEKILQKQVEKNTKEIGAKNAALITLNNKTGEIISFIGGANYFDEKNGGNNNMLLARLQPGSSFKPFIYLLAMMNKSYWPGTIITDNKITFPGGYSPHNSDGKYMGRMTLSQALNHSRNVPAVKLYYAAGRESKIIKFLDKFGMKSLNKFKEEYKKKYGYEYSYRAPMALGTVQITPLELAQAYSVLANNGIKNELKPILKIVNSKGEVLQDFTLKKKEEKIIDKKWAYTINSMLSNVNDRPKGWNYFLTIPDRKLAAKTGTSTKQYLSKRWTKDSKGKWYRKVIIAPRNLWTIAYTPQYTTVVWVGNTSGKELHGKAYGLTGAGPIMKKLMTYIHKGLKEEYWEK